MVSVDVQRINGRGVVPCPLARDRHRLSLTPPSCARRRAYAATGDAYQSPEARDACEAADVTARDAIDVARRGDRGRSYPWHGYPRHGQYQDDEPSC
jgi:hypothetical protein